MTRRQIYFYNNSNNTYYISDEFNGDKYEMESFGMGDCCDKTWGEIVAELSSITGLEQFLQAISKINKYYHSSFTEDDAIRKIGTRVHIAHSFGDIQIKDETYAIISGVPGVTLDARLSILSGNKGDRN